MLLIIFVICVHFNIADYIGHIDHTDHESKQIVGISNALDVHVDGSM